MCFRPSLCINIAKFRACQDKGNLSETGSQTRGGYSFGCETAEWGGKEDIRHSAEGCGCRSLIVGIPVISCCWVRESVVLGEDHLNEETREVRPKKDIN